MPPISPIKRKKLIHFLQKFGFEGPFSGGKHLYMEKDETILTLPNPHESDIDKSFLLRILKQAEISKEDWEKL